MVEFADFFSTGALDSWDATNIDPGCSITFVSDYCFSSPWGIRVDHPSQASDYTDVYAVKNLSFDSEFWAAFYLRIGDTWSAGGTQKVLMFYSDTTRVAGVGVSSSGAVAAMSSASQVNAGSALLRNVFYHVLVHVVLDTVGTGSSTTVYINGLQVAQKSGWTAPALPNAAWFGLKTALKSDNVQIWLDDISISDSELTFPDVGNYITPPYPVGLYCGQLASSTDMAHLAACAPTMISNCITQVAMNLKWSDVEASPGVYEWTATDGYIAAVRALGLQLWLRLSSTPTFYIPEGADQHTPPTDMAKVAAFVSALRSRYAGQVSGIDHIYNEPNGPTYFDSRAGELRPESYALAAAAVGSNYSMPFCAFSCEGRYISDNSPDGSSFSSDSNSDGVCDSWVSYSAGGGSAVYSFLNPDQQIAATLPASNDEAGVQQDIAVRAGDKIISPASLKYDASGMTNADLIVRVRWRDASYSEISSSVLAQQSGNASNVTLPLAEATAPTGAAWARLQLGVVATAASASGTVILRDLELPVTGHDTWAIDDFTAQCAIAGMSASDYDYLGVHNYPGTSPRPPEYVFNWASDKSPWTIVDSARAHAYNNGLGTQLAITEVGWLNDGSGMDETIQARWTLRHILHALARGIYHYHAMFLYDLEDNKKGWFTDTNQPYQIVSSVNLLNSLMLSNAVRFRQRVNLGSDYLWCYEFDLLRISRKRKSGTSEKRAVVFWTQDGEIYDSDHDPATLSVNSTDIVIPVETSGTVIATDLVTEEAQELTVTNGTVTVDLTNNPVLIVYEVSEVATAPWPTASSGRTLHTSLRIGSSTLGWQEFADVAVLGVRSKAMPGGDGSLEFALPGDVAWTHRNVLVPEAEVVLTVDGEVDFGGYLSCDPLRHRLGPQDTLELAATGPWGMAGRASRWAYCAADNDIARWFPVTQKYDSTAGDLVLLEDAGKFTTENEGRLLVKAEGGRAFDDYAKCRLCYWLFNGLLAGAEVVGIDFSYKSYLPSSWEARIQTGADPWAETLTTEWTETGDVSSWSATQSVDFTSPAAAVLLTLFWNATGSTTPTAAPYVLLKDVILYCRMDGASVDRTVTIADVLGDCAAALGVTETRIAGLTTEPGSFIVAYPASVTDVMSAAALLEAAPVEVYFDRTASGFRFTANARPASVNEARNRLWVVGGRGGEDVSGLVRDWEATPGQVEVLYATSDDADRPVGTVAAARYPASVTSSYPLIESVDLSGEPPMSAAAALSYAQMVYAARQDSLYSGDVMLPEMALTASGQEVPTVKLRPGDRIKPPQLLDVDSAGLYVQAVSYDYQSATCTATVGEPWDPLGLRPPRLGKPRSALAAAHPGHKPGRPWRRR